MRHLVSALLVAAGCAWAQPALAEDVPVGFIGPLTGSQAWKGQDMLDGFALAERQFSGRLAGQDVELMPMDDKGRPETAREIAQRLLASKTRLFVAATPQAVEQIMAAVDETGHSAFVIAAGGVPAAMAGAKCHQNLFSLAPHAGQEAEAMGAHLYAQGYRRMALVGPDTAEGKAVLDAFSKGFKGEVVLQELVRPGTMDHGRLVARLKGSGAEGAYHSFVGGMAVTFTRQFADLGAKEVLTLYAPANALDHGPVEAMGDAAVDLHTLALWSEDMDNPVSRRMVSEFRNEYGRPATQYAVLGFETALLLESAFRLSEGKLTDAEAMRTAFRRTDLVSPRGSFRFHTNHTPLTTLWLRQVVRGADGRVAHELRMAVLKDHKDPLAGECPLRWTNVEAPGAVRPDAGTPPRR